jgi:tetratricopeptide (TPR) repeat protein
MKRTERHHLKENALSRWTSEASHVVRTRRREVLFAGVGLAVLVAAVLGLVAWRARAESRADALLAEAIAIEQARVGPPPAPGAPSNGLVFPTERDKLQALADKFRAAADYRPDGAAGVFARYREAATQMALGNVKEASAAYQQVLDRAGDTLYGQMSRLGLAEAAARAGEYERAIESFKGLSESKDGPLPVDGILMQLGRTYLEAGKPAEAQQTFNRIVEEFPLSPFTGEARRELDELKKPS